jgi:XapX domain-containing protein
MPGQDTAKQPKDIMIEIVLALAVGFTVGLLFSALKLPLPSPPVLAGVVGILGIYLGGRAWQYILERFLS